MNKEQTLWPACHQPSHSQSQCDGVLLKYLRQFWNLAGLSKSPQLELSESWALPQQLWQLAEESPQFQLSHYYPGHQVELLGGKVRTFSPNCQLFPPLLSNLSILVTLFYLTRGFVNMKRWRPKKKFELVHKDKIFVPSVLSCLHVPTSDHYSVNSVPNF